MVSIIIAAYNTEKTIERAVCSIINQTYKNIEIIICDDGSSDKTYEIIMKLSAMDNRIIVLHSDTNGGAATARNNCLKVAAGDYIAIMDADDYSVPERIARQLEFLENHREYDFVGTKGQYFNYVANDTLEYYWFCRIPQKEDFLVTLPFVHASLMFRREVIINAGGYSTDKKNLRTEDYEMLMRLYKSGCKGFNIDTPLYFIRLNENTYKRRKYRYRINECIVKFEGYSSLGLMPKGLIYAIKPLIVGIIPNVVLNPLKKLYYKNKQ